MGAFGAWKKPSLSSALLSGCGRDGLLKLKTWEFLDLGKKISLSSALLWAEISKLSKGAFSVSVFLKNFARISHTPEFARNITNLNFFLIFYVCYN